MADQICVICFCYIHFSCWQNVCFHTLEYCCVWCEVMLRTDNRVPIVSQWITAPSGRADAPLHDICLGTAHINLWTVSNKLLPHSLRPRKVEGTKLGFLQETQPIIEVLIGWFFSPNLKIRKTLLCLFSFSSCAELILNWKCEEGNRKTHTGSPNERKIKRLLNMQLRY